MPAILSVLPLGDDGQEYGWSCSECRKAKAGMTQPHALNSLALHNRTEHPEPSLDLSAMARLVMAAWDDLQEAQRDHQGDGDKAWAIRQARTKYGHLATAWEALTGLDEQGGLTFARACAREQVTAHVAPF